MDILISPNSFKGTLSSVEASDIIAEGLLKIDQNIKFKKLPIADGGDGTLELFKFYFDHESVKEESVNSIGEKIEAEYIILDDGKTAFIEYANTCGLSRVELSKNNLNISNSYGFGLQIKSAIRKGVKNIILGLGGSATIDGGCGAMMALGVNFYDRNECILENINPIVSVDKIDISNSIIDNTKLNFTILTDVDNYIIGDQGCVKVYGKQKGLKNSEIPKFESYLKNLSQIFDSLFYKNVLKIKSGGAAGGVAGFLKIFLNAKLDYGSEFIFKKINYKKYVKSGSIIITGEGRLDDQTINMKAPYSLISFLDNKKFFSVAIGGSVEYKSLKLLLNTFDLIFSTSDDINPSIKKDEAIKNLMKTSMDISKLLYFKKKIN